MTARAGAGPLRRLIVVRHAKSAWPVGVPDHERPLAPRGRRDAPAVGRALAEAELAALCVRDGIGVIPYSPLAGGFLTGKYRRGQPLPKSQRADRSKRYMTDQGLAVIDELDRLAKAHRATIAAVALAWQLTRPAVTAPIIGANTVAQLHDLLPAGDLALSGDDVAALDRVSDGT